MTKPRLNIGLIGTGFMGKAHVFGFTSAPRVFELDYDLHLHTVADITPEAAARAARTLGFARSTADWRTIIADPQIDLVSITAPNALHKEMSLAAIAAGKHVYCEKPLAPLAADALEMALAAEARGVKTQVGFNYLCNPMLALARDMIAAGELGEIRGYRGIHCEDYMADANGPYTFRHDPAGGGALADIGSHALATASKQLADIEGMITQGCSALIILAQDSASIGPALDAAADAGIPVVGYDRMIEDPRAFYLTFDNVEVGRMQARAVLEAAPKGRYVMIKGSPVDPNADFLRGGQQEVLQPAIDKGDITIVGEAYTDDWQPANAQKNMEQILTQTDNGVDAVVASNDGTAGGVVAALAAQGMAGIPVSGQDGDMAALNRVALGTQTVSVWKDSRALGKAAGEIAVALASGTAMDAVEGSAVFTSPSGKELHSVLLKPVPVTKDNLDVVLEAGWISKDVLCAGVSGVAVCE